VKKRSSALLDATIVPNGVERSFLWVPLNRPVTKISPRDSRVWISSMCPSGMACFKFRATASCFSLFNAPDGVKETQSVAKKRKRLGHVALSEPLVEPLHDFSHLTHAVILSVQTRPLNASGHVSARLHQLSIDVADSPS
jgi:hypothetical protein